MSAASKLMTYGPGAWSVSALTFAFPAVFIAIPPGGALAQFVEQQKLTASDAVDPDWFGSSISVSGDTIVVGAPYHDCAAGDACGSAYVYQFDPGEPKQWIQVAKLTASDAAANDEFGFSVSISGDTIVVGAGLDNCPAGDDCGSAYVFVRPGGGWSDMTQTAKLTASDAGAAEFFGYDVSIDGDTIVAGAYFDNFPGAGHCGSAYVFVRPGGGWSNMTQTAKLSASDRATDDRLGRSVSISGDTVVAGAPLDDCLAGAACGSAYVFVKPGGGWSDMTQTAKLTASDGDSGPFVGDWFGLSVSIRGDTIVVGASYDDCVTGEDCGSAYVFVKPGGGWSDMTETAKLTASDPEASALLSTSVSMSGDTVVAGAGDDCPGGANGCGAAYVFIKPGGGWSNMTETTRLVASDALAVDYFGASVSFDGATMVVGAPGDDCGEMINTYCGSAYVFEPPIISILYVNQSATGLNDGTNWTNAYRNLQDALAAAVADDQIWVSRGTYKPDRGAGITPGDRTSTFQLINGVALYGGLAGTETSLSQRNITANATILSGDLVGNDTRVACAQNSPDCDSFGTLCVNGSCIINNNNFENSDNVVTGSGTNATAILDGFTIRSGRNTNILGGGGMINESGSPTVTNCTFSGNSAVGTGGGGIVNESSSPTFIHCTFIGNSAPGGGGIYNFKNSSPMLNNCTFSGNSALVGAGMLFAGGSPTVSNCSFSGNSATNRGGGLFNSLASLTMTNCTFSANTAAEGGALAAPFGGSVTITNCAFFGNQAARGGGIYVEPSVTMSISNTLFTGNRAVMPQAVGGAIYNDGATLDVVNSTLSGNTALSMGGGIDHFDGQLTVSNSVLFGNSDTGGMTSAAQILPGGGTMVVNYSIVQGGWPGAGGNNLSSDPLFFDPDGADNEVGTIDDALRLRAGSPAIDAGDNSSVPADTLDLDGDANTAEPVPFDLVGNARFFDGAAPAGAVVDMGAYEFFPDCNNNGVLDSTDIAGASEDCNSAGWTGNGIPDECDIADCAADPGCDDCNLNGIPDGCDIGSGFSLDTTPADGVPDECAEFTGGCATDDWTCPANWPLGGEYPDDEPDPNAQAGVSVILPSSGVPGRPAPSVDDGSATATVLSGMPADVFLDETVTIPTLDIEPGARLRITQTGPEGDLNFSPSAIFLNQGTVVISGGRAIGASGTPPAVTIGPDGVYQAEFGATGVSASLTAASIAVIGNDCATPPDCPHGGELNLTDSMSLTTTGDLVIDGSLANGLCNLEAGNRTGGEAARFNHTPPVIRVVGSSIGTVGGTHFLYGAAGMVIQSSQSFDVAGNWNNQSVRPDCFDCLNGTIRMNGSSPQDFEVAATDGGGMTIGSTVPFVIGTLEIAAGSEVTFVDAFDNDLLGQSSCGEAQYVGTLVLEAGAAVSVQNCRLYYETLSGDPAQITVTGCGEVRSVEAPPDVTPPPSGIDNSRFIAFGVPGTASHGATKPRSHGEAATAQSEPRPSGSGIGGSPTYAVRPPTPLLSSRGTDGHAGARILSRTSENSPGGRTMVARDFSPWNEEPNSSASGGRTNDSSALRAGNSMGAIHQGLKAPGNHRAPSGRNGNDHASSGRGSDLKSEISNDHIITSPHHPIATSIGQSTTRPLREASRIDNRQLAISDTALRINLLSLHRVDPPYTGGASTAFTACEGKTRWAGPPSVYIESQSSGVRFVASQTQSTPYYRDWSAFLSCTDNVAPFEYGLNFSPTTLLPVCDSDADCPAGETCTVPVDSLVYVSGSAVVPSSRYTVQNVAASCAGNEFTCTAVSAPMTVTTQRWGDVVNPFQVVCSPSNPNPNCQDAATCTAINCTTQPDASDFGSLVNKFRSLLGAPIKARALLAGDASGVIDLVPDLGFNHISAGVDAFKGKAYPYTPECLANP